MEKLKAKKVNQPVREPSPISVTVEEIVAAVNAGLNPGGPICNWFEGDPDAVAAVTIKNGEAEVTNPDVIHGGSIDDQLISDLKVVAYRTPEGGVYAEGPKTNAVLEHAVIYTEDSGKGLGGPDTYDNHVIITDMDAEGSCIHEDTGRQMWIELHSATLHGAIVNANLAMDEGSKWFAAGDSVVTLINDVWVNQIDAPEGVTIRAAGGEEGSFDLPSGGKLILTA